MNSVNHANLVIRYHVVGLEQRKNLEILSTETGTRFVAVWKQNLDRWYIVTVGESRNDDDGDDRQVITNYSKKLTVVDRLSPRQFQDAVEKGRYSFV